MMPSFVLMGVDTSTEILNFSRQISKSIPTRSLIFSKCTNSPGSVIGYVSFILSRNVPFLDRDIDEEMLEKSD